MITLFLKVLCGSIAAGLAFFNFLNHNKEVGSYWVVVGLYWLANIFT